MKTATLLTIIAASTSAASAFVVQPQARLASQRQQQQQLSMADVVDDAAAPTTDGDDGDVPSLIVINGKNIELTPALSDYVEKKIGETLKKLASRGHVRECDVVLTVNKNKKVKNNHRVDLNANMKGLTVHCKEESPDMYASIDAVAHALNRKLRKYKERRDQGFHDKSSISSTIMEILEAQTEEAPPADDDDDEFVDPEAKTVTNIKSYDLENGISLQEGIFALDYVDHDFYVFRNKETDKVNIVYKRTLGDVGVIEV